MNHSQLQTELARLGHYSGLIDGQFGRVSKAGLVEALMAGPDTPITLADMQRAAATLNVPLACVKAVRKVEAAGAGFQDGLPKILPEPHRFSKLTARRFDATNPDVSWPNWDPKRYPKTQAARYAQLATLVSLDCDAGLKAASYGAFQIMGENHFACGFSTPWAFVYDQSLTEGDQLDAFVSFLKATGLDRPLRALDWATFARGYNGTAYRQNRYDERLAAAYREAL